MRQNFCKRKPILVMRAVFLILCATFLALPAKAQEILKMTNGTRQVPANGFLFYDSGGPLLFDPTVDPENANEYNWTTWYQHNEDYILTLTVPGGNGVKVEFSKLLINNDFLYFYEGNVVDEANLICILTCNDYSSSLDDFSVISHGNMTIRFESDYHWRDEGWVATITQTDSFVPQPPVAVMAACTNQMVLIPTCNADDGGTMPMQYKLGSGDWQDYTTTGVWVDLSSQTFPLTVTTRTKIDDETFSSENSFTFNKITPPGNPTYVPNASSNTVTTYFPVKPDGVNDTYYIRWTINNNANGATENPNLWEQSGHEFQQPSNTPNTVPAGDIDYTNVTLNTPFYVHFATRGTTCPENFSGVVTVQINERYVPKPTISFETSGNNGVTTLSCSLEDAIIYYTTDGSVPDPEHVGGTYPTHQYTVNFTVQPGTTVNAIAVKTGYTNSAMASAIFIPGGEGSNGNGVYGQVVLLDDREDHNWSYYSDGDQPIHSLNPADVKITYFGNGTNTVSTSNNANPNLNTFTASTNGSVQVSATEAGNQFIYLKTLENANEDGSGDYPYTTIPNPFSKRPVYSGGIAPTRNICITYSQYYAPGSLTVTYTNANGNQQTYTQNTFYPIPDPYTLTVRAGTTVSFSLQRTGNWGPPSGTAYVGCEVRYDNQSGEVIWSGTSTGETVTGSATVEGAPAIDYRGFYAWRVKRLSSGLRIQRANGTEVNVGGIINAEEAIKFVTSKEDGNEVDFEALWAKAYVVRYDSDNAVTVSNQSVGFERNFVVLARNNNDFVLGGDNNRLNNPNNRAVTISSYYPDGTVGSNRCGIDFGGDLDLNYDLKLEYVQNNDYANSEYYINANGHYLCIGRGMTTNYTIATQINAIRGDVDGSDTRIRLESGNYGHIEVIAGEYGTEGQPGRRFHTLMTFGTDYDRATKDNNKLTVAPSNGEITFGNRYPLVGGNGERRINASVNRRERTFTCITKSGKFQEDQFENTVGSNSQSFYIGTTGESNSYSGKRYLTVEGGEFACIAGGRGPKASGDDNTYPTTTAQYVDRNDTTATIRIKKDAIIHGGVYGGAAASAAWGNRKIIITGGIIEGWVAGGCNGTQNQGYGGRGIGDSYIYVGGNAIIGGETPHTIPNANNVPGTIGGNIFGTGRGSYGGESIPSSMDNSYVVIADHCDILHSVYGGGNLGRVFEGEGHAANVYILGGTIHDNVYGGANLANSQMAFIHIKDGVVEGSVYGGSNTEGTANGLAQINMSGGSVGGSVFGGGYGVSTNMNAGTEVNISGGTINNNVYGGGEEGTVTSNTNVNFSGGTVQNVFGAGKGSASSTALVSGQTRATVSGGTVKHCVYGGGEAGDANNGLGNLASTVVINGGTVEEDVFGGGKMGKTTGNVIVNVFNGNIDGNVFGGAYGSRETVYIAGTHTVNMTGGNVYTNVYGGSRNADDALEFNPVAGSQMVNCVNISGGHIYYQVFAGGFFGQNYGSVYAFIGQNAINNAPNHAPTAGVNYNVTALLIDGSVWAGADFGAFDGTNFGDPTVEGNSNVYIDGLGYNTVSTKPSDAGYMNIGTSVLGCGTSCYAGKLRNDLIFRNYGQVVDNPAYASDPTVEPYTTATRNLKSIQFFKDAVIEKAHVHFIGQGRINSLLTTEKYALYEISEVLHVTNGSSIITNFPIDQLMKLGSYTCPDVYVASPTYTKVNYNELDPTDHSNDNKFRINNGSLINVKYLGGYNPSPSETGYDYGEFEGFFFVMTDDENSVCAYARPKQSTDPGNEINDDYDNPDDGGFLSYHIDKNIYDINGGTVASGIQMPYENHTLGVKNGEQYFRIWRYGGMYSYRQGVINAVAKSMSGYSTSDVVINLPASRGSGSYFRIKTNEGGFPLIDYGSDVITVNAGVYNSTGGTGGIGGTPNAEGWMYYDDVNNIFVEDREENQSNVAAGLNILNANVNANFGLVAIPQGSLVGTDNGNWLICTEASDTDDALANSQWSNYNETINPSILFRLTYNNQLTNNVVWDPIIITLEQCDAQGHVTDEIEVALSISTTTTIQQDFSAQTFAFMDGNGTQADTYVAKVVLPSYYQYVNVPGDLSNWTFVSAAWTPASSEFTNAWKEGSGYVHTSEPYANDEFSMQIQPSYNFDNTLGWTSFDHTAYDLQTLQNNNQHPLLSSTDGRNAAAFDFILHFDGRATFNNEELMGTLRVTLHLNNYKGSDHVNNEKDLIIDVEVWRRGIRNIYFLDGVNGNNYFRGTEPNTPKLTLNGIFNHSNYKPGDIIFVVNTVTANGLDWNGEQYNNVIIYRYPGGHPKYNSILPTEVYVDYDDYNPGNLGFTGPLLNVESSMTMHGIILDGSYDIAVGHPNSTLVPESDTYQVPTSPLVNIAEDATLTVYANSELRWNYSNCNGGAIYNAGTLIINNGSSIHDNAVVSNSYNGAGVYLDEGATLMVSDLVTINNNHVVVSGTNKNNNVYLESESSVIQVGTIDPNDVYGLLDNESRIGVTKGDWGRYYYTPIAYSEGGSDYLSNLIPEDEEAPAGDYLIFDDGLYYHLVTLNNTETYEPSYNYLFWVGTWVTAVHEKPSTYNGSTDPVEITNSNDLAWAISVVNGLNDQTAEPSTNFVVTDDIDMAANIWVPIGTNEHHYTGTFDAQGHNITGIHSPLNTENMGMFGIVGSNSTVENMVVEVDFSGGNSVNMGGVAAVVEGEGVTITNVEAAGNITGSTTTEAIGGIVAVVNPPTGTNPDPHTIGNVFSVATMTATNPETLLGGLVGDNAADLINSYANATMSGSDHIGGLVSQNKGHIENCYSVIGEQTFPAFADRNVKNDTYNFTGVIKICYTDKSTDSPANCVKTQDSGTTLDGYGKYDIVKERKAIGYMYDDNAIGTITGTNGYVHGATIDYTNNHKINWNGLLWALNNWVNTTTDYPGCTPWFRPTSGEINGDLPILAFPSDNCLATTDADGKFLQYGSIVGTNANGIDNLLVTYNDNMDGAASSLFLYGDAIEVTNVPKNNVRVYINEDAVLLQKSTAGDFINTTVGISFDNSCEATNFTDYSGNLLTYDWHFLSSSLANAPMGTEYSGTIQGYGGPVNITRMVNNYLPNGLTMGSNYTDGVKWDLYSYYEPQYHWINLKRSTGDHWHVDGSHAIIPADQYTNETIFVPGKGYMMAISQDSYLSSTGKLNRGNVTIKITNQEPLSPAYNAGWNLVGNPYQAYLNLTNIKNVDGSNPTFYIYDADQNVYAPVTSAASDNPDIPSAVIHPHQGFFMYSESTNKLFEFYYTWATTKPDSEIDNSYYRNHEGRLNYPVVNIFAENERGNRDLTVIELLRPELGGATKVMGLRNANFHIAANFGSKNYGILFTPEGINKVPVHFVTEADGTFTLRWSTYNGLFSNLILIDNKTGVFYDMLANDHYTFEASAEDYSSRFYIVFDCTGIEENGNVNDTFAFYDGSEWVISGKGHLDVVDITGRVLHAEQLYNEQNRVNLNGYAKGVYLLRMIDNNNFVRTQKIVVK